MPNEYTKRQHYVPQMYLINFVDSDNKLWVYNKKECRSFKCSPEDICVKNNLYETHWQTDKNLRGEYLLRNHLEKRLSEKEGEYAVLVKSLLTRCLNIFPSFELSLSAEEENILFSFIANLYCRHPWYIKHQSEEIRKIDCERIPELAAFRKLIGILGMGDIGTYVEAATKIATVDDSLGAGPASSAKKRLSQMEYCIFATHGIPFITSDFPLLCGFAPTEDTIFTSIHFPFHPCFAVAFFDPNVHPQLYPWKKRLQVISDDFVIKLNRQFSNDNELCNFLIAHKEDDFAYVIE